MNLKIKEKLDCYENKGKAIGLNTEDYYDIKRLLEFIIDNKSNNIEIIYINQLLNILFKNGIANNISYETIDYLKENAYILPLVLTNDTKSKVKLIFNDCFMFLCPFHNDKRPSFRVLDFKNYGHCLSCNKTVDPITYLQEYEKIKFVHAVELLASIYMIDINSQTHKYELTKKYQEQILSNKYNELLEMAYYRLIKKCDNKEEITKIYQERFENINRIKNNRFDTSIKNLSNNKSYVLTDNDLGDLNDIKKKIKF